MSNSAIPNNSIVPKEVPLIPKRAAFVVGMDRSGTSLLRALLDGHPEIMVASRESRAVSWCGDSDPVASFFQKTRYDQLFPRGTQERETFEAVMRRSINGPTHLGSAIRAFITGLASVVPPPSGARLWLEKTPKHLRSVPVIIEAFGTETRIVGTVRDPRAVMASQARRWKRHSLGQLRHFCHRWAVAEELTCRFDAIWPQFLVVRYEDLVCDTRRTMERVAEHLNVTWCDALLNPTIESGKPWRGNSSYAEVLEGVSWESLESYRKELDGILIEELERLLGFRMLRQGYRPLTANGEKPYWFRTFLDLKTRHRIRSHRRRWHREGADLEPFV